MDAPAASASVSAASLRQSLASARPPLVIDVRKGPTFLGAPDLIRGALRRDPLRVADWAKTLPGEAEVVVYCVHGHEVSQGAAKALRRNAIWKAASRPGAPTAASCSASPRARARAG